MFPKCVAAAATVATSAGLCCNATSDSFINISQRQEATSATRLAGDASAACATLATGTVRM